MVCFCTWLSQDDNWNVLDNEERKILFLYFTSSLKKWILLVVVCLTSSYVTTKLFNCAKKWWLVASWLAKKNITRFYKCNIVEWNCNQLKLVLTSIHTITASTTLLSTLINWNKKELPCFSFFFYSTASVFVVKPS